MAELKTKANDGDVHRFIESVADDTQKRESYLLIETMREISGADPVMYGTSIVGFGSSTIIYADGHTEPWFSLGFSPRKGKFSLYIVDDADKERETLERLGKYKSGKACIWVKRLTDIDMDVLKQLMRNAVNSDR